MRKDNHNRDERGVALLLTIFGLLLLTAVAAAMLYSSNSETMISVNYRDKEAATYAAMSGLQEARNRIHPVFGDLALAGEVPTDFPQISNGQVLYIVNPGPGQTVADIAPWKAKINGKPNPYFDNELCQENMPGLGQAGNPTGVACVAPPSGSAWYTVYDNSASTTNWKLKDASGNPVPLDYKWVRVTLKLDNSAPVYIQDSAPADGTHSVCWDGTNSRQLQKPAGLPTNCMQSTGAPVKSVTLVNAGSGYSTSNPPTVSFVGGGGSGAAATVQLTTNASGSIASASYGSPGSGYTSAPTVTLTADGIGATFQALVKGAPVTALSVSGNNYCYPLGTTGEAINFNPSNPGTGNVATATVTMTGQACISSAIATGSCGNSLKNKALTITSVPGGSGNGFSGTVTLDNNASATGAPVAISNVGSYTAVPAGSQTVTATNGSKSCTLQVSYSGGIQIQSMAVTNGGEYLTAPTAVVSGSSPTAPSATQPALNVTWVTTGIAGFRQVKGIQVTNPGSGYMNPPSNPYTLTISGGGGSGATGTAVTGAVTAISGITLTSGGAGYTSPPQVVIKDSSGNASASATAALAGSVPSNYGATYMLTALAVTRNGNGARAVAQMEAGVRPPWHFKLGGALTLAGPSPTFGSPNSNIFKINGSDANSCGETQYAPLPAIGVYDDPNNPTSPTAQESVIDGLGKPKNYIGAQTAPDIENTFNTIADPTQLNALVTDYASQPGTYNVTGPASSIPNPGTLANPSVTVVNGDLTLSGNPSGYGILVVTGNLTLNGDFSWHGLVLVIGAAVINNQGGGNGQVVGAVYVANTNGTNLGSPTFNWNGGGGNGIQYDHCWADNLLNKYPPAPSTKQLQVLSSRMLQF